MNGVLLNGAYFLEAVGWVLVFLGLGCLAAIAFVEVFDMASYSRRYRRQLAAAHPATRPVTLADGTPARVRLPDAECRPAGWFDSDPDIEPYDWSGSRG